MGKVFHPLALSHNSTFYSVRVITRFVSLPLLSFSCRSCSYTDQERDNVCAPTLDK